MPETIVRACGHTVEFTPHGDGHDEARRLKLTTKNCPPCGQAKNLADNARQQMASTGGNRRIKKGSEVKYLPAGTTVNLVRNEDGTWSGRLTAQGVDVIAAMNGAIGIVSKLALVLAQCPGCDGDRQGLT